MLDWKKPFEMVKLADETQPKACAIREVSRKHEAFVKEKIGELLSAGVIVESTGPWRHNLIAQFDAYPFPCMEPLLNRLAKVNVFSSVNFIISCQLSKVTSPRQMGWPLLQQAY